MQSGQNRPDNFDIIFLNESIFGEIFEEMLIRSQTTTLLPIFCELMLYSQIIFKSTRVADIIILEELLVRMG